MEVCLFNIESLLCPGGGGMAMPASWQSLAAPGSAVADYLSHLPASTLPLSLHHFLKYSADSIKKDDTVNLITAAANVNGLNNVVIMFMVFCVFAVSKRKD